MADPAPYVPPKAFANPNNVQVADSDSPAPNPRVAVANPIPDVQTNSNEQLNEPNIQVANALADRGQPRDLGQWGGQAYDDLMKDESVWKSEHANAIGSQRARLRPVVVHYPSGHTVEFPSETHANTHAASVWERMKHEWTSGGLENDPAKRIGQAVLDKVGEWRDSINSALEEAGAELGRKPAELISGAKNIQALMPSPYGQKPAMESVEETGKREHPILSGTGEATGRFVGTMLTPENVAIMAAMPGAKAVPLLSKALSAGFAIGMSRDALANARTIVNNWDKMTPQQRTSALTSSALQTVMAGLATVHAVSGEASTAPLKGESGEMKVPLTGGTVEGAKADTEFFRQAKEENPEGTVSDWARIAQEKKAAAGKPPVRQLSEEDKAAATEVPDVNEKGQKLGVKPIEATGKPPVIEKAGHPDYNEKGQLLGVRPPVEDIGGKVRAEAPAMPRETGERRARVRTPQEIADTQYFRQAVRELGQDATNDEVDERIAELKKNRVVPPSSAGQGILGLLKGEEGSMRVPFTGTEGQGELFPGGEIKAAGDEERAPVWYSHAIDTIQNKVEDGMSGNQVRGILINNGVTPDEMHGTGLGDYLSGKGKVSKAALEQHMQENQIRLHDLHYGTIQAKPEVAQRVALHQKLGESMDEQERQIFTDVDNGENSRHPDSFLDMSIEQQKTALGAMTPKARQNMLQYLNTLQARLDVAQETTGWEIRENPKETEHANGKPTYDIVDPTNGHVQFTGGLLSVNSYLNEEIIGDHSGKYANADAKWPDWVHGKQWENQGGLGATDYTEKLMMLPEANKLIKAWRDAKTAHMQFERAMHDKYAGGDVHYQEAMSPEEKAQEAKLREAHEVARKAAANHTHTHSHWSTSSGDVAKNVVAFARYGRLPQFTDKPTMILHEFQSDWNTDIKHSGYIGEEDELNNRIAELTQKKEDASKQLTTDNPLASLSTDEQKEFGQAQKTVDAFKARLKAGEKLTPAEKDEFREAGKRVKELTPDAGGSTFTEADQKDLDSAAARVNFLSNERIKKPDLKPPVPKAPLVNNWVEVGAKRMLREMVDNGFKRMVWPTGESAADLYGVHTHIKEIRYNPSSKTIDLVDHSGQVKPQSDIPTTPEGLMERLELPEDQAKKLSKQIEDFKAKEAELDQKWEDEHGKAEEDENDDRPTEEQYRDQLRDQVSEYFSVDELTNEPTYEIWHDGQFIDSFDGSEYSFRAAREKMREWWEDKYPEHDWKTGEYTGELDEAAEDHPGDMEAPELREEEGDTSWHVVNNDGDIIDTFDSESRADSYRDRLIDDEVRDMMENASADDYKPDEPEVPNRPKTPKEGWPKLEGIDLHFGGKLHRLLYDEMLPKFLSKYLKQWGAKVSKIDVPGGAPPTYKYSGPDIPADDLEKLTAGDYDPDIGSAPTWGTDEEAMLGRIVDTMRGTHKSFSQVVDDMQEGPHFDASYEQRMPRTGVRLSTDEKAALSKIAHRVGGEVKKEPGKKEFWQIETTPQMERALKTKPQRISQMAAPKIGPQRLEQTA